MGLKQNVTPLVTIFNETRYLSDYSGCYLCAAGEVVQTNDAIILVKIGRIRNNKNIAIFDSFPSFHFQLKWETQRTIKHALEITLHVVN